MVHRSAPEARRSDPTPSDRLSFSRMLIEDGTLGFSPISHGFIGGKCNRIKGRKQPVFVVDVHEKTHLRKEAAGGEGKGQKCDAVVCMRAVGRNVARTGPLAAPRGSYRVGLEI